MAVTTLRSLQADLESLPGTDTIVCHFLHRGVALIPAAPQVTPAQQLQPHETLRQREEPGACGKEMGWVEMC